MAQITAFGKEVKKRLVDIDHQQAWLVREVRKETGQFFDGGYLRKILTGQRNAPKMVHAIRKILDLPEQDQSTT